MQAILDSACVNPIEQSSRSDPKAWPMRHLPPGKLADLYMMYTAWARARSFTPGAASTFRVVWKLDGWKDCLRFRKESTHSLCFQCGLQRARIAAAETVDEHIAACALLHAHLRDQYKDRAIYWQLRTRSRAEQDLLCIIADGMDHSKFAMPQWAGGRAPKHTVVDKNNRPTCSLYGVLAHGWRLDLYISHEGVSGGSEYSCDMVLRTIDAIWKQCQKEGKAFPLDCSIQGDNTTKELKNSVMGRILALLAAHGVFRAAAHQHLRVGHTHEDIDQIFGLIARLAWHLIATGTVGAMPVQGKTFRPHDKNTTCKIMFIPTC